MDEEIKLETQQTYAWVFEQCLIMLHPFMPFITEEIWLQKKDRKKLIIHQTWPDLDKLSNIDNRPQKEINWLIDLIQEIRSARSEINIPASLKIDLIIINLNIKSK